MSWIQRWKFTENSMTEQWVGVQAGSSPGARQLRSWLLPPGAGRKKEKELVCRGLVTICPATHLAWASGFSQLSPMQHRHWISLSQPSRFISYQMKQVRNQKDPQGKKCKGFSKAIHRSCPSCSWEQETSQLCLYSACENSHLQSKNAYGMHCVMSGRKPAPRLRCCRGAGGTGQLTQRGWSLSSHALHSSQQGSSPDVGKVCPHSFWCPNP